MLPRVKRGEDGSIEVLNIPIPLRQAIRELPALLADDAPGMEGRLKPNPFPADEREAEEWRRLEEAELTHLFKAARDTVVDDLAGLRAQGIGFFKYRLTIPPGHATAWLSALSAARLALGDAHGIGAEEMGDFPPPWLSRPTRNAVLLVHLLGWLQALIVEGTEEAGS